ncbi:MAG: glycerol-3-phosphate 1-O-acyltransferase PlsY [Planctomycetes bacterium]|nr:glycerol-3-phosphate 1-O-acyltransferase PlsY [Planctomycetota bacterium]
MLFIFLIVFAYLLGAVPFGFLIARYHGKDLREIGSGNIGATNTGRVLGRKWGIICMILDALKGLIPMLIAKTQIADQPTASMLWLWLAVGCAAISGHIFPVYLKFKGGKGVATSLGMVLGLFPYYTIPGIITFAVWALAVLLWKYISLASILAAAVFPVILFITIIVAESWKFSNLWPLLIVALLMPILVVVRHAENIKRLLEGSETRVMQSVK